MRKERFWRGRYLSAFLLGGNYVKLGISYLLSKKMTLKLSDLKNKHLLLCSFCGSEIKEWLNWMV